MSNYPKWWDQTLTVFNKYQNPTTKQISWYKTTLENCFWKYAGDKLMVNETTIETNTTLCRIPKNDAYLERFEWEQLDETAKADYFCLGTGDIIVKGAVDDVINEYESGKRSSDLLTKYRRLQGCMLIERCANNTGTARGVEHYYVKGV